MPPATLGRGLDALLSRKKNSPVSADESSQPLPVQPTLEVSIDLIDINPHQPRIDFNEESMQGLADSIRQYGILQPLIVMKTGNRYELIAGERRLRGAKIVGLSKVPVVFRDADVNSKIAIALIENIQRVNLNPIELAIAYKKLHSEFGLTHEMIAQAMGKKRPSISNMLRLLTLPSEIQDALRDGRIDFSLGKIILTLASAEEQLAFFQTALEKKLNALSGEQYLSASTAVRPYIRKARDTDQLGKEEELRAVFGTKVVIRKSKGSGTITLSFYSDDEYRALFARLGNA